MKSIRTRFTALTAIAVIISVLAVGAVSAQYFHDVANNYLEEILTLKCGNMAEDIDGRFRSIEQCVDTVALYAEKHLEGDTDEDLSDDLEDIGMLFSSEVLSQDGVITYYFRLDPEFSAEKGFWYAKDGEDFKAQEPSDIKAYSEGDPAAAWFYSPKAEGRAMWLDPYDDNNLGGVRMISYVRPVYVGSVFAGVAEIDFDYETLRSYTEYDGRFEGAVAFLADENGKIIVHPDYECGTPVTEISGELEESLSADQSMTDVEYKDKDYRVSAESLSNGMVLYLAAPESSVRAHWSVIVRNILLISALMLAVFASLSAFISSRIVRPLTKLTEAAGRINEGDYDFDLDYDGDDEVGMLTDSFRRLTNHLKAYISDLNDMAYKDALTSVRNTGAFDIFKRKLDDSMHTPGIKRPEFAICMFDCNDLKEINDNYGHDKGDTFLKNACALICDVYSHSPVFRVGGDEFICILQNEDFANRDKLCKIFFERMEVANAAATEPWEKIDVAGGMAVYDPSIDKNTQDVFNRADTKMYENKQNIKEQSDEANDQ